MKQFRFLVYGKDERQRCLKEILENRGHVAKNAEESSAGFFEAILLPLPETETFFGKIKEELVPGQIVFGANFGQSVACQAKEKKITVVDYMKADGVAEKNAVSVAEGSLRRQICAMRKISVEAAVWCVGSGDAEAGSPSGWRRVRRTWMYLKRKTKKGRQWKRQVPHGGRMRIPEPMN